MLVGEALHCLAGQEVLLGMTKLLMGGSCGHCFRQSVNLASMGMDFCLAGLPQKFPPQLWNVHGMQRGSSASNRMLLLSCLSLF